MSVQDRPPFGLNLKMKDVELPPVERVVVAVSGGADSTSLLHYVCNCSHLHVTAAHFNHKLRSSAALDEKLVASLAESFKVDFVSATPDREWDGRENVEAWARRARYKFLEKVRCQQNASWILTGHTEDDLVETLFLKLLSAKEPSLFSLTDLERRVWRPLIHVSRGKLRAYGREHNVPFLEDESNRDTRRLRNRIRQRLLPPLISEFGDEVVRRIARSGHRADEAIKLARHLAARSLPKEEPLSKEWKRSLESQLAALDSALQWRVAEEAFFPLLKFRLGRVHGKRVVSFFLSNAAEVELPTCVIRRRGGALEIIASRSPHPQSPPQSLKT